MYIKKNTNETVNRYLKAVLFFIILLAFVTFFIGLSSGSYLSHADKEIYKPNKGKGFESKVNTMLAKLLLDTTDMSNYSINSLNRHYKFLGFTLQREEGSELINKNSIRLIAVTPNTEEDKKFIHNSYLSNILKAQNKNISKALFRIKFNEKTLRIESIIVEPGLYDLVLKSNNNLNNFAINNPYFELDNKVLYVISELNTVPLFASNSEDSGWEQKQDNPKFQINSTNLVSLNEEGRTISEFNPISNARLLYTKARENKSMGFQIENTSSEIRIYNNDGALELKLENFESVELVDKEGNYTDFRQGKLIKKKRNELPIKLLCRSKSTKVKDHMYYHEFKITDNLLSEKGRENVVKWSGNSTNSDFFTNQTITALNNIDKKITKKTNKVSCINPLLSKSLEDALKIKVKQLKKDYPKDIIQISMVLMDINTGELLAAPFYSSEFIDKSFNISDEKNYNFSKHFIGSAFKPLLSNASSIVYPKIGNFKLVKEAYKFDVIIKKCNLLGYPFNTIPFSKNGSLWTSCNSRVDYLFQSHDLYPIIQTMLALTEKGDSAYNFLKNTGLTNDLKKLNNGNSQRYKSTATNTKIRDIDRSTLAKCISDLYGIPTQNIYYNGKSMYKQLYDSSLLGLNIEDIPNSILPENVTLNANLLGNINKNDPDNNTDFTSLTAWILGQGTNEWTNIHLAQAYARLFSKKNITMTLWQNKQLAKSIKTTKTYEPSSVNASWSAFLEDFKTANTKGKLLPPALATFKKALISSSTFLDKPLNMVGKTGTPDNYPRRTSYIYHERDKLFLDEGLYTFGILSNYNTTKTKGITGVVYIKRISGEKPTENGINSSVARDFLSEDVLNNILFYTKSHY